MLVVANYQLTKTQILAMGLHHKIADQETLLSLAEIAAYMQCGVQKVRDCIKHRGLPAFQNGRSYFTTKTLVDQWIARTHIENVIVHKWDRTPIEQKRIPNLLADQQRVPLSRFFLRQVEMRFKVLNSPNIFKSRSISDKP
jgi:excisionase family DNA binding protein